MDMFGTPDYLDTQSPLDTLKLFIERGDAKGAVHFLRQLNKEELSIALIKGGFSLTGNYRDWINHASDALMEAAEFGRLPHIRAMNGLAKDLYEHLTDLGKLPKGARSSQGHYCLSVEVCSYQEAITLGMALGNQWGPVEVLPYSEHHVFVIFCDTRVQA